MLQHYFWLTDFCHFMHFFFLCECRFLHFFPCIVSKNLYLNWNLSSCCFDVVIRVLRSFSEILDKPQFLADVVGSSDRVESPPRPFSQSIMSRNPFPSQVNSFFLLVFRILLLLLEYNVFRCISLYADPVGYFQPQTQQQLFGKKYSWSK